MSESLRLETKISPKDWNPILKDSAKIEKIECKIEDKKFNAYKSIFRLRQNNRKHMKSYTT